MGLGNFPTLLEVNTELETVNQSLLSCIANAGKTGVWDSQLDFAGYSAATPIAVTYDFSDDIQLGVGGYEWQRVDILPSGSNRNGNSITVNLDYYLSVLGQGVAASVWYGVGSDNATEPTWFEIASISSLNTSGTKVITVPDGKFLFIKSGVSILSAGDATADLTLRNGSIVPPGIGTAIASGSPLNWYRNVNDGI